MEVNGAPKQPGYKLSSKCLPLCSAEQRNSYRFGTTWGWENDDRIFIFGWTIPLSNDKNEKETMNEWIVENTWCFSSRREEESLKLTWRRLVLSWRLKINRWVSEPHLIVALLLCIFTLFLLFFHSSDIASKLRLLSSALYKIFLLCIHFISFISFNFISYV